MTPVPDSLEQMIFDMKITLASVKTDVQWLKRLFTGMIIVIGAIFGVDVSGVI